MKRPFMHMLFWGSPLLLGSGYQAKLFHRKRAYCTLSKIIELIRRFQGHGSALEIAIIASHMKLHSHKKKVMPRRKAI